jgi:hypothetical protein
VSKVQTHAKNTESIKKSTIKVQDSSENSNKNNITAPTVDPDLAAFLRLHTTQKLISQDRRFIKPPALDTLSDADEDQFNAFINGDDADSPTREYNQMLINLMEKGITDLTPLLTSKQKTPKERLALNSYSRVNNARLISQFKRDGETKRYNEKILALLPQIKTLELHEVRTKPKETALQTITRYSENTTIMVQNNYYIAEFEAEL